MGDKVLFVDDESSILQGIRRNLRKIFEVHLALGGEEGLAVLENEGPFAVVVSDMRMPEMDGIHFLSTVKEQCPDTVRVMLTGQGDMSTAIAAVNEGNIFRFLTKPCPPETLVQAVRAGIRQYQLIRAEKELLENTLKGSVAVLIDILSLTNPSAFSRAMRIKHYVVQVVESMQLDNCWQYEIAAMLSQIGCVTVPSETMEKFLTGDELSDSEQEMIHGHPEIARDLLSNIPRLEIVAGMIAHQNKNYDQYEATSAVQENPVNLGGQILKATIDFDALLSIGASPGKAVAQLEMKKGLYNQAVLAILEAVETPTFKKTIKLLKVSELRNGMALAEDIRGKNNMLIVAKGQEVNHALSRRLQNFASQRSIDNTVRVYVMEQKI